MGRPPTNLNENFSFLDPGAMLQNYFVTSYKLNCAKRRTLDSIVGAFAKRDPDLIFNVLIEVVNDDLVSVLIEIA